MAVALGLHLAICQLSVRRFVAIPTMSHHLKLLLELCELRTQGKLAEVWDGACVFLSDRDSFDNIDLGDNVADFVWWDHFVGRLMDQPVTGSKDREYEPDSLRVANLIWGLARQKIITRDLGWFSTGLPEMFDVCRRYIGAATKDVYESCCSGLAAQRVGFLLEANVAVAQVAGHLCRDINNLDAECIQALQRATRAFLQFLHRGHTQPAVIQASGLEDFARFAPPNTAEALTWCRNAVRRVLNRVYQDSLPQLKNLPGNETAKLSAALAMVEHGVRWLIGDLMPMDDPRTTTILFALWRGRFEYGSLADLSITRHTDNSPDTIPIQYANAFYPDPVWLGLTALDDDWLRGFALAHEVAIARTRPPGRCAWRLAFPPVAQRGARLTNAQESPYHSPYQRSFEFAGASGSAAACCALIALGTSGHLDPGSAITAELQPDGSLKDVESKIAKVLGLPDGRSRSDAMGLELDREQTLEGIRFVRHFLVRQSEDWLKRHAQKRQIQVHHVEALDEALAIMSGRLEKVLDFLNRLAVNGLIQNVQFRPPGLVPADIAGFCLPVRVVDEDDWQRLEKERSPSQHRSPDERDYIFPQSEEFSRMNGDQRTSPRRLEQVLTVSRRVVIRGEPGEGKTTALYLHVAHRCRELTEGLRTHAFGLDSLSCRIPLPLSLSRAAPRKADQFFSVIRRAYEQSLQCAYGSAKKAPTEVVAWLETKIERGEIDLHLDALDELDSSWHETLRQDLERTDPSRTSEIGVFLTTRISANDRKVLNARRCRMVCFGPAQVHEFVTRYFSKDEYGENLAQQLRDQLKRSPGPRELAQIPLLLALLCERMMFAPRKPLPETRTKLMQFALHRLLERGDATRGQPIDDPPTERNLIKEAILRHVAWHFFALGPLPIVKKDVLPILDAQLGQFEGDKHGQPRNASALLKEFLGDGILVRQEEGVYRFVLRSLHEYALAGWIAWESPPMKGLETRKGRRQFSSMIRGQNVAWGRPDWPTIKPLNQPSWRHVWPLVAGQMIPARKAWLPTTLWQEGRESEDLLLSRSELAASCFSEITSRNTIGKVIRAALTRVLLSHSFDVSYRIVSARSLGYFSESGASKVLVRVLCSESDLHLRRECAFALARIGNNEAIAALINQFDSVSNFRVQMQLAEALGKIGDQSAVGPLIDVLDTNELGVASGLLRISCAIALAEIGDIRASASLAESLKSGNEPMGRCAAAIALGRIAGESALPALAEALQTDDDWNVRGACVHVLGDIANPKVLPLVANALLHDPHMSVRRFAADVLAYRCEPASFDALLTSFRTETNPRVQRASASALAHAYGGIAHETLNERMRSSDTPYLRWLCMMALGKRDANTEQQLLLEALQSSDVPAVRRDCAKELAQFPDRTTRETLIRCLTKDPDKYVRKASAESLGLIGDGVARSALIKTLSDCNEITVLTACAEGLASIGDAESVGALRLSCGLSDLHRHAATEVFSTIKNEGARDELVKGLGHDDEGIRFACMQGLRNILDNHGWRPFPHGSWESPSGMRIAPPKPRLNDFAPDFGLLLRERGLAFDGSYSFWPFAIYSLATSDGSVFSTTSLINDGGQHYAVTLDFDRPMLDRLLTLLPGRISQSVQTKIMETPAGPWTIMFGEWIRVEITARLGQQLSNDAEVYVPLIVVEVNRDVQSHCRSLQGELMEIGKNSGFMSAGEPYRRAREIGVELNHMGGMKLMQAIAEHVISDLYTDFGLVLGRALEYCWDGIGGWSA